MPLASGTKLGPYEIQSLIGAGGMGEVYRARDTRLQRDVAIKILPSSFATDPDRLRRFEQEARAVAALNHPNLLTVFDVGTLPPAQVPSGTGTASSAANSAATSPFIVSELLEGGTLRERLASGALRERKAVEYAIQIARGLAAAHERGIVHRDLKPENVFVTEDGRVKILDFGLAKLTETSSADPDATMPSGTQAGVVMGTIGYMSPEQVRGKPADARSDIFSFGTVLYEMLGGRRAFHGDTAADLMSSILNGEPAELTATNAEISPALDRIVHHCLEKDAKQRFQSAGDLAFQLGELSGMRTSSSVPAMAAVDDARKMPAWWVLAAAGAAAVALLIAGTWFVARATSHNDPPVFRRVTYQRGSVDSARFLSDGQSIICASRWGTDSTMSLYTGRLDSQGLRPLGAPADSIAAISPSGEVLVIQNAQQLGPGYVRAGTLARLALGGGAPRPVVDSVQYADWAPDGKDFAIVRFLPEKHVYTLEYPTGKVLYQTNGWISHPRFSRDGKKIGFLDHAIFGDDQGMVAVVDLAGNRKAISSTYETTQGLAWSPDGKEIWFSGAKNGVSRTLFATTMGGRERQLLSAPGDVDVQDVLADGRVLVADVSERHVLMVWTPEHPEGRDFTWMDWAYGMRFSSDGTEILFGDQHSGDMYGTFLRNLDGSPAVRLGDGDPLDISADGKWAISRLPVSPDQIELLPTGAGTPRQLTHSNIEHLGGRFFPDGRIIAYGNEPGHRERAYLVNLDGSERPLTPEGFLAVTSTGDGKRVLTVNLESREYRMMPVDGGPGDAVPQLIKGDIATDFAPGDDALLVRRTRPDGAVEFWRVELPSGKRTLLRTIPLPESAAVSSGQSATVSRDGKSYGQLSYHRESTEYVIEGLR